MRPNWINIIIGTVISVLIAWWLYEMGIDPLQQWLLAALGGTLLEVCMLGAIGFSFDSERSGVQLRIIGSMAYVCIFAASCIFSFFQFSAQGYCIPLGVFFALMLLWYVKIYSLKQ